MDAVTLALLKALGGGSGLPSTGSASAGDVLTLDNNKDPQWAAPSGGGVLVVNVDENYTFDKTATEVYAAFIGGTNVLVCTAEDIDGYYAYSYEEINRASYDEHGQNMYSFAAGAYIYNASTGSDYPVRGR